MHSGRLFSPLRSIFQHFLAVLVIYGTVELAVSFSTRERCAGAIFVAILTAQRLRRFCGDFQSPKRRTLKPRSQLPKQLGYDYDYVQHSSSKIDKTLCI